MKKVLISASIALGVLASQAVSAGGAELYKTKTCWACHGKDAKTTAMPSYPKIAGQNEAYIIQQMRDIKSGKRNNGQTAAMKGVMGLVSDDDIQQIAKYLSSLK